MGYNKEQLNSLLFQKLSGNISVEDDAFVEKAIVEDEEIRALWISMKVKYDVKGKSFVDSLDEEVAWARVRSNLDLQPKGLRKRTRQEWISIAAVLIFAVTVSYYFFSSYSTEQRETTYGELAENSAIKLKLADGTSIPLSDNGVMEIGDTKLNMVDGKLVYQSDNPALNWNTLSVPHKLNLRLVLSDGTEVWMNSASHLRFPFNFNGKAREVYLEGEAYFKVAKDADRPFIVHANGTEIEVLGTSFNVSSYGDSVVTSLVEGSVMNRSTSDSLILRPGFQSVFSPHAGLKEERFESNRVLSWMQGVHYFENIPLDGISDVVWRWFEVKLIVEDPRLHKLTFTGAIEKNKSLDVFIRHLELTSGIKADFKGRELHLK